MHHWILSALIQIMACCLFGTKPLSKPMLGYSQLNPEEQTSMKFQSKYKTFHSRKWIWKYHLRNGGHFVQREIAPRWMPLKRMPQNQWGVRQEEITWANVDPGLSAYGVSRPQWVNTSWWHIYVSCVGEVDHHWFRYCNGLLRIHKPNGVWVSSKLFYPSMYHVQCVGHAGFPLSSSLDIVVLECVVRSLAKWWHLGRVL